MCEQDPFTDHTGKDPSEDRNRNRRRTGGIPTRKGGKKSNQESQNTDPQSTRAPETTVCAFWTSKRHSTRSPMISSG